MLEIGYSPGLSDDNAVCDVMEQRPYAERAVILSFGQALQLAGKPFNGRLTAFLDAANRTT